MSGHVTLDDLQLSILSIENNQSDKIEKIVMNSSTFEKFKNNIAHQYKNSPRVLGLLYAGAVFGIAIDINENCEFPVLIGKTNRHYTLKFVKGYVKNNKLKFISEEK